MTRNAPPIGRNGDAWECVNPRRMFRHLTFPLIMASSFVEPQVQVNSKEARGASAYAHTRMRARGFFKICGIRTWNSRFQFAFYPLVENNIWMPGILLTFESFHEILSRDFDHFSVFSESRSGRNIRRMYLELDFFPPFSIHRIPRRWFGCVLCAIRNLFDSYILYRSYRRERYVDTKRKRLRKKRLSLNGIERYCFTKKKWWFHDRRYI